MSQYHLFHWFVYPGTSTSLSAVELIVDIWCSKSPTLFFFFQNIFVIGPLLFFKGFRTSLSYSAVLTSWDFEWNCTELPLQSSLSFGPSLYLPFLLGQNLQVTLGTISPHSFQHPKLQPSLEGIWNRVQNLFLLCYVFEVNKLCLKIQPT